MKEDITKALCTYDCDMCNKTYQDDLYPEKEETCYLCPECRVAFKGLEKTTRDICLAERAEEKFLCPNCNGTGESVNDKYCRTCKGSGEVYEEIDKGEV